MTKFITVIIVSIIISSVCGAAENQSKTVSLYGNTLSYNNQSFLGLGVSYMSALRHCKIDRSLLEKNLKMLSKGGFNYIRILSMVGWYSAWDGIEIAPVDFTSREGKKVKAWTDYDNQLADLIDIAYDKYKLRTQITIFADAQLMPEAKQRVDHMNRIHGIIKGREHKIIMLEVANEAWQNGFPEANGIAELRDWCRYLNQRTSIPISISSPSDSSPKSIKELYDGSEADIATVHFTRDTRTEEGSWLSVRECRIAAKEINIPISSNEPIGPGSSVDSETNELKLVSAAVFAYMSGLPMYVYHTAAGVFSAVPFEEMQGLNSYRYLTKCLPSDLPNWNKVGKTNSGSPLEISCQRSPYGEILMLENAECLYSPAAYKGNEFISTPMGIGANGLEVKIKCDAEIKVYDLISGKTVLKGKMSAGDDFFIPQGSGICAIRGKRL